VRAFLHAGDDLVHFEMAVFQLQRRQSGISPEFRYRDNAAANAGGDCSAGGILTVNFEKLPTLDIFAHQFLLEQTAVTEPFSRSTIATFSNSLNEMERRDAHG
jgi:hypothetical protein